MRKLAIVSTFPILYHAPVWRALAKVAELDTHVYFGSDLSVRPNWYPEFRATIEWGVPLTDGYEHTFLSKDTQISGNNGFFGIRALGLERKLREFNPDCTLILGYSPFFWLETAWVIHSLGIPMLLRTEATDSATTRSPLKNLVRSSFLRALYSQYARFLAIGENARRHYLKHGVPPSRIYWSPYCIDTEFFEKQVGKYLPQRDRLREELGFRRSDTVFIYSGKLIPKKDPLTLARALQSIPEQLRQSMGLIVMGDGELRPVLEADCHKALGARAVFAGVANQRQLGRYYTAADCLILPSAWGETWGVVVNEALQFGLPAIVSDRVGSGPDLVIEGETGATFPAGNADALRVRMLEMIEMLPSRSSSIADRCRQQVSGYSTQVAVEGIRQAVLSL